MYMIKYVDPHTSQVLECFSNSLDEAVEKIKSKRDELYFKGWVSQKEEEEPSSKEEESGSEQISENAQPDETSSKPDEFRYSSYFYDEIEDDYDYYGSYF